MERGVAPVRLSDLKGYLLEEIVAYMLRNAGYRLFMDPKQDPDTLVAMGNGLCVRGRGALHQADALGQLMWVPAFMYPMRLFVEAKCLQRPVGVEPVRNAIAILLDLNQKYLGDSARSTLPVIPRFAYGYALFSTSGFSDRATKLAMAHQVSLVDLSGPEFRHIAELLDSLASRLVSAMPSVANGLRGLRMYLRRRVFGTWPYGVEAQDADEGMFREDSWTDLTEGLRELCHQQEELLMGFCNGPFLLLLKPRSITEFERYASARPSHDVIIQWESPGSFWVIRPAYRPDSYELVFRLPRLLSE